MIIISECATNRSQRTTAVWTEISFDVPANNANMCHLDFFLNTNPLKNAPLVLSGQAPYTFNISRLEPRINKDRDTWNTHPKVVEYAATVTVEHGGKTRVDGGWFACPKGQVAQFLLMPGSDRNLKLEWYELDYRADEGGPHGVVLDMYT
ncbi:hypothetical protein P153DRAFT_366788 [Dothidotthia symphoricarpi CBS 119687]|uniref:Ubiquitin 3 binding protein But2 C-terminal domain-containing protein n=1 Tax=Dothidotthia symphoricarpi CBS 119687 TaxID=1392245 RepID=A0A6A6AEH2_9PLEO|nr:uncharacterized protein P153DRAFT_366788 [Dothidotthia symphoricarpi CBS 119687]KAF2129398.1 hypothetical protein P153DRAFT_366788 [Dothidotthia symphoricarpi CBS 119687]